MIKLRFPEAVLVARMRTKADPCYDYAVRELIRLLGRLGIKAGVKTGGRGGTSLSLKVICGKKKMTRPPALTGLVADDYVLSVGGEELAIAAKNAKGVLNGVYDLAQRLGFLFILPGEKGEWAPEPGTGAVELTLPAGELRMQARFNGRGLSWEGINNDDYPIEEWYRYYAKLRLNTIIRAVGEKELARELGFRLEVGGHQLPKYVPREEFAKHPEMFRMAQPEDFGGKRTNDYNFCVTNARTRTEFKRNFRKKIKENRGVYAIHAWPDDLPGGGWCLCPSCRSFTPADQAMVAVRWQAEVIREEGGGVKIPLLAYHDTMMPGENLVAPPEGFLFFAPRERCYGHALGDPQCRRNRSYLEALKAWEKKCRKNADAHSIEYYFDQILFRGMYPFLPGIILGDMLSYHRHGIKTHLSLQVAGPAVAPEYNLLVFAEGAWNGKLTSRDFIKRLAGTILPGRDSAYERFLLGRAQIFESALKMCDHDLGIYLDFRWLPESPQPFAKKIAGAYATAARDLKKTADQLAATDQSRWPKRTRELAKMDTARARFEAAEFAVMALQQLAMYHLGQYHDTGRRQPLAQAVAVLEKLDPAFVTALSLAKAAGITETTWYAKNINGWLRCECRAKLQQYRTELNSIMKHSLTK